MFPQVAQAKAEHLVFLHCFNGFDLPDSHKSTGGITLSKFKEYHKRSAVFLRESRHQVCHIYQAFAVPSSQSKYIVQEKVRV